MKGRGRRRLAGLATALMLLTAVDSAAADIKRGISTKFVEVLIEGVPLASRYVLEGKTVELFNGSDIPLKIRYDADVPGPAELRPGYDPIPDAAWISFEPRNFTLEPGRTGTGRLVLYIPDDKALVGKRFQAMLFLHTDSSDGGMVGIGLRPRLLFSIGEKGGGTDAVKVVNNPVPQARVTPFTSSMKEASIVLACEPLTVANLFGEEMTYEIEVDAGSIGRVGAAKTDTVITNPDWIEISPPIVVLPANKQAEVAVTAKLPLSMEHFGRTYVAALRTVATRKGQKPVNAYNKVRITVPGAPMQGRTGTGNPAAK